MLRRRIDSLPDDEWKRLYQFQEKFRSENNVTASDLLVHFELPLSLLQYLYTDSFRPSNKIGTFGKSLREKLKTLKEKTGGVCGCDFPGGNDPAFVLREIYELNKDKFGSCGVSHLRLGDEILVIIASTISSLGIPFDHNGVEELFEGTQFAEYSIRVEKLTFLSA